MHLCYQDFVRKLLWIIFGLWLCGFPAAASADTYPLTDGTSITGDVISFNDDGVIFHTADDKYTDRISWTKFSQDALKALAKDPALNKRNPPIKDFAEPFIETPPPARPQVHISVHSVSRLELPPKQSVIGALFSSGLGIILLLLIYAANIYAGYEIAIFRARPIALVAGIAAILPIIGPIIFLSMPTVVPEGATEQDMQMQTGAPPEAVAAQAGPATETTVTAEALHVAPDAVTTPAALPETQVFQRGQFTFNRRFFETKFSSFFGVMRHGSDKEMVLVVKTPRATHVVQRISRIAANDAHFEVALGAGRQEVMVPFGEIQEIQLKHKDA